MLYALPYGLIPPLIKRARILVDCVVAIVTSVKFYRKENMWLSDVWLRYLWLRALPEYSRFPISSDQKQKVALCAANKCF
jgi:hypothetical protein